MGIGHTRWATHGEPNDINAHPHVSANGSIALVHNGIIENYLELKEQLQRQGVTFASDTDSEVVAQLLEFHYGECGSMLEAVGRCLRRIRGSYALGIICADYPNALIAARKDSPLLLGFGATGNFIASDATAILEHTREVAYLNDGEIAVITADSVDVFDSEMVPLEKERCRIDWDVSAAEKGGYPHFMFKEIDGAAGGCPKDHLSPYPGGPGGAGGWSAAGRVCERPLPDLHHRLWIELSCGHGVPV